MTIKVTPAQLDALSGRVAAGSGDIAGTLAGLAGQIAPLAGGEWAGPAAGQFQAMWQQWQDAARRLTDSLSGISGLLSAAARAYEDAESSIASSFRVG